MGGRHVSALGVWCFVAITISRLHFVSVEGQITLNFFAIGLDFMFYGHRPGVHLRIGLCGPVPLYDDRIGVDPNRDNFWDP